jgi:hypothetical protein
MTNDTTPYLSATDLAKHIRKALKAAFPRTKFSVRSDYYSMGSSVRIRWTDGPTTKQVDAITDRFSGISFDGSDDSTHYNTIEVDGQTYRAGAYITTSRSLSDEARAIAERVAAARGAEFWPT